MACTGLALCRIVMVVQCLLVHFSFYILHSNIPLCRQSSMLAYGVLQITFGSIIALTLFKKE